MRDPNLLLTTIAQITATFVAILGGFLLTLAIQNRADQCRHRRRLDRLNRLIDRSRAEREAEDSEQAAYEEKALRERRQVYHRFWRGDLTRDQAKEEEVRLIKSEIAFHEEHRRLFEERIRQLEADEFDDQLIMDSVDDLVDQSRAIGVGLYLLAILGMFGIGVPLLLTPVAVTDQPSWLVWSAQRGFLVLLALVMGYVWVVAARFSDMPPVYSRRASLAFAASGGALLL